MKIGDHELQESGRVDTNVEGKTPSNEASVGEFHYYRLTGPKGLDVELAYVTWANGERDFQVTRAKKPAILPRCGQAAARPNANARGRILRSVEAGQGEERSPQCVVGALQGLER
jgi:hypothetical protein